MTLKKLTLAYAGLLVLLAMTVGSSFLSLGGLNTAANLAIAAAKSAVIILVFMNFLEHGMLPRLAAAAAALWLLILFVLTLIDRGGS